MRPETLPRFVRNVGDFWKLRDTYCTKFVPVLYPPKNNQNPYRATFVYLALVLASVAAWQSYMLT